MKSEAPQYLYKVLSISQWQATQNMKTVRLPGNDLHFVHLATEEQLERVLTKFWSDEPQFAVLKLVTDKLEGKLVHETNRGGSRKYYHLYDGFIPFEAIVESRIVYREPPAFCCQESLPIVEIGDPVLRTRARDLTLEEIRGPEIQELIAAMIGAMRQAPGVGLAAPQIGKSVQLVVVEDMDQSHLSAEQIEERERYKVPLHVIINPRLYLEEGETAQFFEGCISVPQFLGVVSRAKSVRVECLNERGEPVTIHAKGWYARILQHEIDHLNGTLYLDRVFLRTLTTDTNYVKLWQGKKVAETLELCGCRKNIS